MTRKILSFLSALVLSGAAFAETTYTVLESLAGSTAITLGVNASATLQAELDMTSVAHCGGNGNSGYTFGAAKWNFADRSYDWMGCTGKCGDSVAYFGGNPRYTMTIGTRYLVKFGANDSTYFAYVYDQASMALAASVSSSFSGEVTATPVCAFGHNTQVNSVKLYEFAEVGDTARSLVAYYIPVVQHVDDVDHPGLYDAVTKTFYENTSGTYTCGEARSDMRIASDGALEVRLDVTTSAGEGFTLNGTAYAGPQTIWARFGASNTLVADEIPGKAVVFVKNTTGTTAVGRTLTWTANDPVQVAFGNPTFSRIEYLQSTGTQSIKLGATATATLRGVLDWATMAANSDYTANFFGAETWKFGDSSANSYYYYASGGFTGGDTYIYAKLPGWGDGARLTVGTRYVADFASDASTVSLTISTQSTGLSYGSNSKALTGAVSPNEIQVFGNKSMRVYSAELYDYNGDLERELFAQYVPVVVTLGDIENAGFFDLVSKSFYSATAGADDLIRGDALTSERIGADGSIEYRLDVTAPATTAWTLNGTAYAGSQAVWAASGAASTLVLVPEAGKVTTFLKNTTGTSHLGDTLSWSATGPASVVLGTPTFTLLETLTSTGSQSIPVGVNATATMKAWLDFIPVARSYATTIGTRTAADGSSWRFFNRPSDGSGTGCRFHAGQTELLIHAPGKGGYYELPTGTHLTVNFETDGSTIVGSVYDAAGTTYLAGGSTAMSGIVSPARVEVFGLSQYTFYEAKLWDFAEKGDTERTLLRDLVPVIAETADFSVTGVYDTVERQFYADDGDGTTDFTCGAVVADRRIGTDGAYAYRLSVTGSVNCAVTVNGQPVDADGAAWLAVGTPVTVVVTPASGAEVVWTVTDGGTPSGNTLTATLSRPLNVTYITTDDPAFVCKTSNWTGNGGDTNFTNAANWDNGAPDITTKAVVAPADPIAITLADGTQLYALELGGASAAVDVTVGGGVRIVRDFTYGAGTMTFNTAKAMSIGGDLVLSNGVRVTHKAVPSSNDQAYKVNFAVNGDVFVDTNAVIHAEGRGYSDRTGPGYSGGAGFHAGATSAAYVYGCLYAPTNCGSASWSAAGGGVVRLVAGGKLTVNGTIQADAQIWKDNNTAAGGSVWITCASLAGASYGRISANGGDHNYWGSGSGGRVAIWFTGDEPMAAWSGTVQARGSFAYAAHSGPAGTVYYQYKDGDIRNSTTVIGYQPPNAYDGNYGYEMDGNGTTYFSAATGAGVLGTVLLVDRAYVSVPEGEKIEVYGDWYCNPATHYNSKKKATYPDAALKTTTDHTIAFCGTNAATVTGYTTFSRFACNAPGKKLLFGSATNSAPAQVMSVDKRLEIVGENGKPVWLYPTNRIDDCSWFFTLDGEASVKVHYARIGDSKATVSGAGYSWEVPAYYSQDDGSNDGWYFDPNPPVAPGATMVWKGGAGTQWMNANNWDLRREPDPQDHLVVWGEDENGEGIVPPVFDLNVPDQTINDLTFTSNAVCTVDGTVMSVTNLLTVGPAALTVKGTASFAAKDATVAAGGTLVVDANTVTVTGTLTVRAGGTLVVTNAAALVAENLVLESGATARFDTGTVTVGGNFTVAAGASVAVTTAALVLEGHATFGAADVFGAGYGTVTVTGAGAHTLAFADATNNALTVDKSCGEVLFAGGFTANNFKAAPEEAQVLTFGAGARVVAKILQLAGESGGAALLTLRSEAAGQAWKLVAQGGQAITGVLVSDCDAREGNLIVTCAPSAQVGENVLNWKFDAVIAVWTGLAGDANFTSPANWSDKKTPTAETWAIITPESGSHTINLAGGTRVHNILAGGAGGSVTLNVNGQVTVEESLGLLDGAALIFNTSEKLTAGGDFTVGTGATVTHKANGSSLLYAVGVIAGGGVTVENGALIDVDMRGYAADCAPTIDGTMRYAAHGGSTSSGIRAYDSVFAPKMMGGGGAPKRATAGAGVVYLEAGGALVVSGTIKANGIDYDNGNAYSAGAGGSIWLKGRSFAGNGTIRADGALSKVGGPAASGGRIAVELTDPASDFSQWTGLAQARFGYPPKNGYDWSPDLWGGSGTVWFGWTNRRGTILIGGAQMPADVCATVKVRVTDLPMADDGDGRFAYRKTNVKLVSHGRLYLTGDLTVNDLDLAEPVGNDTDENNVQVYLNGHTLLIHSRNHVNGRGWYDGWQSWVDAGEGGQIRWLGNTVLKIR